jgi:hypothetical protein
VRDFAPLYLPLSMPLRLQHFGSGRIQSPYTVAARAIVSIQMADSAAA